MNRSDHSWFAPIWADMLRAWPAAKPIDGTSRTYAKRLAVFEPAEVVAVVDALTLECEFMPSIATIWQRCVDQRDQAPGWEDAWAEAEEHAGGTDRPWSHEAAQQAARTIGLYEIRTSTNPAATRAQFRDAYQSILQRRRREMAASQRELPPPARPALESSKGA
jgi:hypothetical protein